MDGSKAVDRINGIMSSVAIPKEDPEELNELLEKWSKARLEKILDLKL